MKMFTRFIALFAMLLTAAGSASAQSNLVLFVSASGDYVGQGQTSFTTDPANFSFSGSSSLISVGAFGYAFDFAVGSGTFGVATYSNTARYPFNGSGPGLDISGNGRGCNTDCGSFQILEFHTDGTGAVDRLWLTYSNRCECFNAPMIGEIRYHSASAPATPSPRVIHVPADYPTIQMAMDASSLLTTDTILVSPGTYSEAVNFKGKRTTLLSSGGPAVTFIAPPAGTTAVTFAAGETSASVFSGFTLTNASVGVGISSATPTVVSNVMVNCGTGVSSSFASPVIRFNQITGCSGAGISLGGAASALLEGNIIRQNHYGIAMNAAGSPVIRNNFIQNNIGEGITMGNQCDANIIQNVIIGNTGHGIYWLTPSGTRGPWVINNTIAKNSGSGIFADGYDGAALIINNIILGAPALSVGTFNDNNPPIVQFNDIFGSGGAAYSGAIANMTGIAGNISADPMFNCDPTADYRLFQSSPAINGGTNGAPQLPGTDIQGTTRILARATNGQATVDLGAYEFDPAAPPNPCIYINCPVDMVVGAPSGQNSATVNFPAPTGPGAAAITTVPVSGAVFSTGTNIVNCTATIGTNTANCSFTVTVLLPPVITNTPFSTNVPAGQTFNLSAASGGTPPLTYRWTFENSTIAGATDSNLTVTNAQAVNEGVYRLIVTNLVGSATGAVMSVRVLPTAPVILNNPASLSRPATTNATFSVLAGGSQPFSYQWFFTGGLITGATSSVYSVSNIQSSNSGSYQVIVSNALGSATSTAATLAVTPMIPFFTVQPVGGAVGMGAARTLSGLANGSQPIFYQWQRNATNLTAATQSSLSLANFAATDAGSYALTASNIAGVSTSSIAILTAASAPSLIQPLTNQVVDAGNTVVFSVNAGGALPLSYSWQFNGQALAMTNSTFSISNIQLSQAGYYRVTVANGFGILSSTSRVSVLAMPSSVIAWGDNSGGQTNVPSGLGDIVAVAGGDFHSMGLHHDGKLVAWGFNGDGQCNTPTNSLRFVSIAAGSGHGLAVTENGAAVGWGRNESGQRSIPSTASNGVVAVAAGDAHSLALLGNGSVVGWGNNSFGQISVPGGLTGVRSIVAGRNHSLALITNGTISGWGYNAYGQASPPSLTSVAAISAGYLHSVALLSNGTVVVWGDNTFGQTNVPVGLSNVIAVAAGDFHTLALRANGSVVGWGDDTYGQLDNLTNFSSLANIASGYYHGLAMVQNTVVVQPSAATAGLVIKWAGSGTLQWSTNPAGPYVDISCVGNLYTNSDMSLRVKFFRLRR